MGLIAAVLLVKNEAKVLRRTLDSLVGAVDAILVLDTGSTDGTQDVVRACGDEIANYVHLVEEPFVDYATSRNRALELAAEKCPTVFTLTLSADEVLEGGETLRKYLAGHVEHHNGTGRTVNAYCVMRKSGPRQWPYPLILRSGGEWKYANRAGQRHEEPVGPEGEQVGPLIPGVVVVHAESDPKRKLARLRERDLPDLTAVVEEETTPLSDRMESMLQLAETHFILGHEDRDEKGERPLAGKWLSHLFQAMALYARYGEAAERFSEKMTELAHKGEAFSETDSKYLFQKAMYAHLMYLHVAESFGLFEPPELVKRAEAVANRAPHLPEAHWMLAKNLAYVDHRRAIPFAMKAAKVAHEVYEHPVIGPVDTRLEYKAWLLAVDCSRRIGDKKLVRDFAKRALAAGAPPEDVERIADVKLELPA